MLAKGNSPATVSIYLRALRAVFNRAISDNDIEPTVYPFGRGKRENSKYSIPTAGGVKKALSQNQLKAFFNSEPQTPEQQRAKDFWFFSYACNGINTKDIANLKFKNLEDDKFYFIREKTKSTAGKIKTITVYLNEFTKGIIEKYGNNDKEPNNYVFDIISLKDNAKTKHSKISNFNRSIGQHIKKICKANDLPEDTTMYWARHSFATNAVRNGATTEFIQESLGHDNIKTTQSYLNGFEDDVKRNLQVN